MAHPLIALNASALSSFFERRADFFDALEGFEREFPTPDHSNIQVHELAHDGEALLESEPSGQDVTQGTLFTGCTDVQIGAQINHKALQLLTLTQAGECWLPAGVSQGDLKGSDQELYRLASVGAAANPAVCCALKISYDGSAFAGFARQPGLLTVQGSVEQALSTLFHTPLVVECSGRTDAGVHARTQVLSFNLPLDELIGRKASTIKRSLQALVDEHIVIQEFSLAPKQFSARFSALAREYHYHLRAGQVPALFARNLAWHTRCDLDLATMQEAARLLQGEYDFKSFCTKAASEKGSTTRHVETVEVFQESVLGEELVTIRIVGNAFLHNMVRIMVGSLVAVGKGVKPVRWIDTALSACDRSAAGETAPAQGLVFWDVRYPVAVFNQEITEEFFQVISGE